MIDYLGFSLEVSQELSPRDLYNPLWGLEHAKISQPVIDFWLVKAGKPEPIHRKPYRQADRYNAIGMTYAYGAQVSILYELSGTGIAILRDNGLLKPLLLTIPHDRVTRIDLCADYPDLSPHDIVNEFKVHDRIKSRESKVSSTGTTLYFGSRSSESFCRVYQYNDPHPRAGISRIEHQIGKTRAKVIVKALQDGQREEELYAAMQHRIFENPDERGKIELNFNMSKDKADKINPMWLERQVYPALRGAIQRDELTIEEIVEALTAEDRKGQREAQERKATRQRLKEQHKNE